jgi:hypothetical protein
VSPAVRKLNRQVHIYIGLALLLFTILFSGTGLLLNHHWAFAEFWPQRKTQTVERSFQRPAAVGDIAVAKDLMRQLGLRGEISKTEAAADGGLLIQANRPGENLTIEADLIAGRATVERTKLNGWGVVHTLHTFIGVSAAEPERRRDWWLTHLWSLAIDATAIGFVLLVAGGLVEAWAANPARGAVVTTFVVGAATCLAFVLGLIR